MASLKAELGGLITDKPILFLPGGTASKAQNVEWALAGGALSPRSGFGKFSASMEGAGYPLLIRYGGSSSTDVVIVRLSDGIVRIIPSGTAACSKLTSLGTGSTSQIGSVFVYGGEIYHISGSVKKVYDAHVGSYYDVGVDRPSATFSGAGVAAAGADYDGGGMFGYYRYCCTYYDPLRDWETLPSAFSNLVSINTSDTPGSQATMTAPAALTGANANYTKVRIYRTRGTTENWGGYVTGAGTSNYYREYYTNRAFCVGEVAGGAALTDKTGDNELNARDLQLMYDGSPPPACNVAVTYGNVVIYLEPTSTSPDLRRYYYWSLPGKPGMVPQEWVDTSGPRAYKLIRPKVPINRSVSPIQGKIKGWFADGTQTLIFTAMETYRVTGPLEAPQFVPLRIGSGVLRQTAISPTMSAIGLPFYDGRHLCVLGDGGIRYLDVEMGVSKLLGDIAVAKRQYVTVSAFNRHGQIWLSYADSASTWGDTIVVFDYVRNKVSKFLANFSAHYITGMAEHMADPSRPILVFTDDGEIWEYPNRSTTVGMTDNTIKFTTDYRALFGQETHESEKAVNTVALQWGNINASAPTATGVQVSLIGKESPSDSDPTHQYGDNYDVNVTDTYEYDAPILEGLLVRDDTSHRYGRTSGRLLELRIESKAATTPAYFECHGIDIFDVTIAGGEELQDA